MKFEWNHEERWVQGGTKKTRFALLLKTFLSPACGWKLEERK